MRELRENYKLKFVFLPLCFMPFLISGAAFLMIGTNSGTNPFPEMVKDKNKNLPYKRAVLRDRKGDLSKEWFVEFYAWSELEQKLVRKRVKIPQTYRDKKSRTDYGNKLIAQANKLLEQGYHFAPKKPNQQTDLVQDLKVIWFSVSNQRFPPSARHYGQSQQVLTHPQLLS